MTVKGAIGIVVLVIPHVELYSRHQDVLEYGQTSLLRIFVTSSHICNRLRRVGVSV